MKSVRRRGLQQSRPIILGRMIPTPTGLAVSTQINDSTTHQKPIKGTRNRESVLIDAAFNSRKTQDAEQIDISSTPPVSVVQHPGIDDATSTYNGNDVIHDPSMALPENSQNTIVSSSSSSSPDAIIDIQTVDSTVHDEDALIVNPSTNHSTSGEVLSIPPSIPPNAASTIIPSTLVSYDTLQPTGTMYDVAAPIQSPPNTDLVATFPPHRAPIPASLPYARTKQSPIFDSHNSMIIPPNAEPTSRQQPHACQNFLCVSSSTFVILLLSSFVLILLACCYCKRWNRNDTDTPRGRYRAVADQFGSNGYDDAFADDLSDDDENEVLDDDDEEDNIGEEPYYYNNGKHDVIEMSVLEKDRGKLSLKEMNG